MSVTSTGTGTGATPESQWHTVARVVFPAGDDDVLPLYVDYGRTGIVQAISTAPDREADTGSTDAAVESVRQGAGSRQESEHSHDVRDRRRIGFAPGTRTSFASYFNAFPASYWRRWTDVSSVKLRVHVEGDANVIVYRSRARGVSQRVETASSSNGPLEFVLDLKPFADGGWYWFDVVTGESAATLVEADWQVLGEPVRPGTLSIGVTTLNRPDYCLDVIRNVAGAQDLRDRLDTLYIVDQGTTKVASEEGFDEVAARMGDQLRVIDQANLGGSGGFSRGMYETVVAGRSTFHMMLDDDVMVETEGIVRALDFATYARVPTIVGGHMFDMYHRTMLHAFGEEIDQWRWFWGPVRGLYHGHDLAASGLRQTPWMHQRVDVDYNGWWMCLVPVEVIKEIGLSLPVFIKWDDAEYGFRAKKAGYPTVSLPGSAVWHVSWTDKDDAVDWQAYYHEHNRWVSALLHSPYDKGGRLLLESANTDMRHIWSMQYYAQEVRLKAMRALLEGPDHLHETLPTTLGEVRGMAKDFDDSTYSADPDAFPAPTGKPKFKGREPKHPSRPLLVPWLAKNAVRQLLPASPESRRRPEAVLPNSKSKWWILSRYDSAVVSKADGTAAAFYRRDPQTARRQMTESAALRARLRSEWERLSEEYRAALPRITSLEAWEKTFGIEPGPAARALGRDAKGGDSGE